MRHWDGEVVLCNPLSGHTHLLDVASGGLLAALAANVMSERQIGAWLSSFLEIDDEEQVRVAARGMLVALDELGLIEPAPHC